MSAKRKRLLASVREIDGWLGQRGWPVLKVRRVQEVRRCVYLVLKFVENKGRLPSARMMELAISKYDVLKPSIRDLIETGRNVVYYSIERGSFVTDLSAKFLEIDDRREEERHPFRLLVKDFEAIEIGLPPSKRPSDLRQAMEWVDEEYALFGLYFRDSLELVHLAWSGISPMLRSKTMNAAKELQQRTESLAGSAPPSRTFPVQAKSGTPQPQPTLKRGSKAGSEAVSATAA